MPAAAPIGYLLHKREKRFQKFEEVLPAALDLMVTGLRAGHSIVSALELVGRDSPYPIGHEFRLCFDEQNYGLELRDALNNLTERIPLPDSENHCYGDPGSEGNRRQSGRSAG